MIFFFFLSYVNFFHEREKFRTYTQEHYYTIQQTFFLRLKEKNEVPKRFTLH